MATSVRARIEWRIGYSSERYLAPGRDVTEAPSRVTCHVTFS
jgi:hypothetical protein